MQPAFAARIDGTPLDLRGETLPFDDALESVLHVKLDGLDLPTYLGYSPVRLTSPSRAASSTRTCASHSGARRRPTARGRHDPQNW